MRYGIVIANTGESLDEMPKSLLKTLDKVKGFVGLQVVKEYNSIIAVFENRKDAEKAGRKLDLIAPLCGVQIGKKIVDVYGVE